MIYALEVIYIYCICGVEMSSNRMLISSQLHIL